MLTVGLIGACHVAVAGATVSVQVTRTFVRVRPIASGFLGLALEYRSVPTLVGDPGSVNPVLLQLIRNLDPTGRPEIRIGGQSTDRTWWPIAHYTQPLGITYDLTPSWIARARALAAALDARMSLGLGLEANRPRIDAVEAQHLLSGIGRPYIDSLQIGNEPELYAVLPWYRELNGTPVPWYDTTGSPVYARSPGYGPDQFAADYERVRAAVPRVPIAGPETGNLDILARFAQFLSPHSQERTLTWHAYGLNDCVTNSSSPQYPSVPNLLSTTASRGIIDGIGPYVADAHRDGASFRVDEMGSVSCNGQPGVSNTFASALWVLDALFADVTAGVDGVDLHTYPGSDNGLFDFVRVHGHVQGIVHPLYYGALMFAQAAPVGSRLLGVHASDPGEVRSWATLGPDGSTRVLVINDDLSSAAAVDLGITGTRGTASLERLSAPSAGATAGISLGGRGFGARTASGTLRAPVTHPIVADGGRYGFTVPAAGAALITVAGGA
jgi:hypothetical protein